MQQHTQEEIWKPVVGHEGRYEVSDLGRIRSIDRRIVRSDGLVLRFKGRKLQPGKSKSGHLHVILGNGAEGQRKLHVHRAVMDAFVGPLPDGKETCHKNGDPADNRLANLRYDSHAENMRDIGRYGVHHNTAKSYCKRGHLLAEPNLTKCAARRNGRNCLACSRGMAYARRYEDADLQETTDWYYRQIVGS